MDKRQIREYLSRIGIEKTHSADLEFLGILQNQHLLNIPFENLDIWLGKEIILDYENLYNKIILNRRGGYCYELNGLFCILLRELGYSVDMLSARVYNSAGILGQEFDHMILLVHLDDDYLVDVGFGDSFRKSIKMPEGEMEDASGKYRIRLNPDLESGFFLEKQADENWKPQYQFTTTPRELEDYQVMNSYHQTSPESHFTQKSICTIATDDGRISLSDDYLTITENKLRKRHAVNSKSEFKHLLKKYFEIEI